MEDRKLHYGALMLSINIRYRTVIDIPLHEILYGHPRQNPISQSYTTRFHPRAIIDCCLSLLPNGVLSKRGFFETACYRNVVFSKGGFAKGGFFERWFCKRWFCRKVVLQKVVLSKGGFAKGGFSIRYEMTNPKELSI